MNNKLVIEYIEVINRIFKRFYMPTDKGESSFFEEAPPGQKYIYINGKKTECKRIHNFYTSQNYKTSYGKAFGKTKHSFKAY